MSGLLQLPGRLAVFRRQFESETRRPGMDPATFATELEILAVLGFGDMGKRARDWMIRDRFIAAQRSCGLHRHLDGVSSDTPIRDIVDRCRVWESHSVQKEPSSGVGLDQDPLGWSSESREPGCLRSDPQELVVCPVMESRVHVHVASVIPSEVGIQRKVGNGDSQLSPGSPILTGDTITTDCSREPAGGGEGTSGGGTGIIISRTNGGRCGKRSLSNGAGEGVFLVRTPGTWGEPMFTGGHFFSVLVAGLVGGCSGWPISSDTDRRNWNVVYSGKRGMVRVGGSASRIIGDRSKTDPGGGDGGSKRGWPAWQLPAGRGLRPSWTSSTLAFPPLGSHPTENRGQDNRQLPVRTKVVLGNRNPIVPDSPIGMGRSSSSVVPPVCPELGAMGGGCGLLEGIGGLHRE